MKHTLTVLLCVGALAGASIPAVSTYAQHQAEVRSQKASDAAAAAAQSKRQDLKATEIQQLETQCAHDKSAYYALPVAVQAKTPAPVCPTVVK